METPARGDGRRDRDLGKAARRRGARSDRLSLYRYVDDPGPAGQGRILDIIQDATGITALATSRLVLEALQALGLRSLILLSPYKSNQPIIDYLGETGFTVVHDVALGLEGLEFAAVTPDEWAQLARRHDQSDADGIFLSCTN